MIPQVDKTKAKRVRRDRLRLDTVSSIICEMGKKAGVVVQAKSKNSKIKYASAHDFRRSFGERWSMVVMPPVLQQLMRHSSITTTMNFYVGRNAEKAAAALWEVKSSDVFRDGEQIPAKQKNNKLP